MDGAADVCVCVGDCLYRFGFVRARVWRPRYPRDGGAASVHTGRRDARYGLMCVCGVAEPEAVASWATARAGGAAHRVAGGAARRADRRTALHADPPDRILVSLIRLDSLLDVEIFAVFCYFSLVHARHAAATRHQLRTDRLSVCPAVPDLPHLPRAAGRSSAPGRGVGPGSVAARGLARAGRRPRVGGSARARPVRPSESMVTIYGIRRSWQL